MSVELSPAQLKNYDFFISKLPEYLANPLYSGKYAVISQEELKGIYDTVSFAYTAALKSYPVGEFIIQEIIDPSTVVNFVWPLGKVSP